MTFKIPRKIAQKMIACCMWETMLLIERANKRKTPLTAHSFFVVKERFLLMAVKTDVFMLCCFWNALRSTLLIWHIQNCIFNYLEWILKRFFSFRWEDMRTVWRMGFFFFSVDKSIYLYFSVVLKSASICLFCR